MTSGATPADPLTMNDPANQRIWCLFSGHVQGVGFRYTARSIASGFDVRGYVRNLPDGRVELVAEGDPAELNRFVSAIEQRMSGHIDRVERTSTPPTGEFPGFVIRH